MGDDHGSITEMANTISDGSDFNPSPDVAGSSTIIIRAMLKATGAIGKVKRSGSGKIPGKNGAQGYSFAYSTLNDIIDALREPLKAHGLSFVQDSAPHMMVDKDGEPLLGVAVTTVILHESGQMLRLATVAAPPTRPGGAQGVGGALAYARRYSLITAFGIPTEDEHKAGDGAGNAGSRKREKPEPREQIKKAIARITAAFDKADHALAFDEFDQITEDKDRDDTWNGLRADIQALIEKTYSTQTT